LNFEGSINQNQGRE